MKFTIIRIILGLVFILFAIISFFEICESVFKIYDVFGLYWVPILATFIGFYGAGLITKKIKIGYTTLLLLALLIFIPVNFFSFPYVIILFLMSAFAIILARNELSKNTKLYFSLFFTSIFLYSLFNQPLIIKQVGFGYDLSGNLVNAKQIWNFNTYQPKTLKDDVFFNLDGQDFDIQVFKEKIIFINFWATWCGPCLAEKPKIRELKEAFNKNDEIIFIDISLDDDVNSWKTYLEKNKPLETQLISGNSKKTRMNFDINSLPKKIIVNRNNEYKAVNLHGAELLLRDHNRLNEWMKSERLIFEKK